MAAQIHAKAHMVSPHTLHAIIFLVILSRFLLPVRVQEYKTVLKQLRDSGTQVEQSKIDRCVQIYAQTKAETETATFISLNIEAA